MAHKTKNIMRVIEKNMLAAINSGRDFKQSNTQVFHNAKGAFVKLYNTIIYAKVKGVEYFSDGGYSTVTTSSRLRALGAEYSTNEKRNRAELHTQTEMYNLFWSGCLA